MYQTKVLLLTYYGTIQMKMQEAGKKMKEDAATSLVLNNLMNASQGMILILFAEATKLWKMVTAFSVNINNWLQFLAPKTIVETSIMMQQL